MLLIHVLAGIAGLLLTAPVLLLPKRRGGWHPRLGRVFVLALVLMSTTSIALALRDLGQLAGFLVIGTLTLLAGGLGFAAARWKPRWPGGWLVWHINGMGSASISFITAWLVQITDGSLAGWLLPTVVGAPLIARRTAQLKTRRPAPASAN